MPTSVSCLEVLDDAGQATREIALTGSLTVGRGSPEFTPEVIIPSDCQSASRKHATIAFKDGRAVLTDLSRFGTLINGSLVERRSIPLNDGDEIVFGQPADGWRVRFRTFEDPGRTRHVDPLESLVVTDTPRQIRIGQRVIDEQLGDAFELLKFLNDNKGAWYPVEALIERLWPVPDKAPYEAGQALSRYKKKINDLLRPHLSGRDAIDSWPHRGYRMRPRADDG